MSAQVNSRVRVARCGHEIPSHSGRQRLACDACAPPTRGWGARAALLPVFVWILCPGCCERKLVRQSKTGPTARYCTRGCNDRAIRAANGSRYEAVLAGKKLARAARNADQTCVVCQSPFAAVVKRKYCSDRCSGKADRQRAAQRGGCTSSGCQKGVLARGLCSTHYNDTRYGADRRTRPAVCEHCKKDYRAQRTGQRFCSLLCRNGGEFLVESTEAQRSYGREARRRRRARIRETKVEKFTDLEIFERDRWRCGVCKRKVDRRLQWPHPMSPSLDHVIPQAPGQWGDGEHTRANVRLAHLRCNIARGNRGGNEQLALIG